MLTRFEQRVLGICLLVSLAILLAIILRGCPAQVQVEQAPSRILLPLVFRNWNARLAAMRGVAASGNGGAAAMWQTGASWYLNWYYQPSAGMPDGAKFIPMISIARPLSYIPQLGNVAQSEYLMLVNEPNIWGQGEVCPIDYVEVHHIISERFGANYKLVSPGVNLVSTMIACEGGTYWNCAGYDPTTGYCNAHGTKTGMDWLTEFRQLYLARYGDPQWQVLSWHCYPSPEATCNNIPAVTEAFVALARQWGIKKVIVSEWDAGKGGAQNPQRIYDAMAYWQTVPEIMAVFYYQDWRFSAETGNSPLTNEKGEITEYGRACRDAK